jgi:hypothetical protein
MANLKGLIVSPKPDTVGGWNFTDWGDESPVDVNLDQALPGGFDIPAFNREMIGLFRRTRAKARQTA